MSGCSRLKRENSSPNNFNCILVLVFWIWTTRLSVQHNIENVSRIMTGNSPLPVVAPTISPTTGSQLATIQTGFIGRYTSDGHAFRSPGSIFQWLHSGQSLEATISTAASRNDDQQNPPSPIYNKTKQTASPKEQKGDGVKSAALSNLEFG